MNSNFHHLTRAVVIRDNQVLLVHAKGEQHTFLPGGHIEFGESATNALIREIQEELGMDCNIVRFLGLVEHQWGKNGQLQCEINQIFEVELPSTTDNPISKESKLEFFWSPIDQLQLNQLEPKPLCDLILKYVNENTSSIWWESTLI